MHWDPNVLLRCDRLILPGVGAFGDAAQKLRAGRLDEAVKTFAKQGKPVLGVCLGMQLLFAVSFEYGRNEGLGLLDGAIRPLAERKEVTGKKIPQMGWNSLIKKSPCAILSDVSDGEYVYYVHSYYADGDGECCYAYSDYGVRVAGVVGKDNVFGTQFHPEKSGDTGLRILKTFSKL